MKKILIILLILIGTLFVNVNTYAVNCSPNADEAFEVWDALDECLDWSKLVDWNDAGIVYGWLSLKIKAWVNNIALYLWIFAVWSIVYGWLMMTLSAWEDDKIKKAKDIVKWWIFWFLWLISTSAIINLIVKIMYSL
jgi:hypothetical protein